MIRPSAARLLLPGIALALVVGMTACGPSSGDGPRTTDGPTSTPTPSSSTGELTAADALALGGLHLPAGAKDAKVTGMHVVQALSAYEREEISRTIEGVERDAKYLESMGSLAAPPEGLIRYDRASDDKIEDDDEDGAAEPPKVDAPTPAPEAVPAAKPAAAKPAAAKPAAAKPAATKPAAEAGER